MRTRSPRRVATISSRAAIVAVAVFSHVFIGMPGATSGTAPAAPRVALFGDSLAWEAQDHFRFFAGLDGIDPDVAVMGGTAICDYLPAMAAASAQPPEAIILAFSGNSLTPCMTDQAGQQLSGSAVLDKYRDDATVATHLFPHSEIYFVGAPRPVHDWPGHTDVASAYRDLAAQFPNVNYVDGGELIAPHGEASRTQPCLWFEPCIGPLLDLGNVNIVRAPDGNHFCPVAPTAVQGVIPTCDMHSSGALRYALTMLDAIEHGQD